MSKQIFILAALIVGEVQAGNVFNRAFAPQQGMTVSMELPYRQEICLNGKWAFQPVGIPAGWNEGGGVPPELELPATDRWEAVPIKIPSPWNVNSVLHDKLGGGMDSRTYPGYPESWNRVRMGWLRRPVEIPGSWKGDRVYIHLEAVAGDCRILVNGKEVGFHFDVALPGEFDITDAVKWGQENEILLGIRDHRLYAERGTYGKLTYPTGSFWLQDAVGVWQDVFLLTKPQVHVSDIFMQPLVEKDLLTADVEVVNSTAEALSVQVEMPVFEWVNHTDLAKENMLKAPEISWSPGNEALRLRSAVIPLHPGETKTVRLQSGVKGRLEQWELWNRGKPQLYMASAQVRVNGKPIDTKVQRFGWREVKIENGGFMLNGKPVKLAHEFWHFTGIPNMSRRYVWSWYTLAMDANVNFIRPHAMPFPRYFYDMADEMGMLLIDEGGIFASHCDLNYDSEDFWKRCAEHTKRLVRRDRNHPSILGWSVSNEIWCVLRSRAPQEYQEKVYDRIFGLCRLARAMDPTRNWVQSDGDKDLNGRLDLWTIHCGSEQNDTIPPNTLWGVTEGGSAYFGKPGYYRKFAGDRVYRSFDDRLDALAIECYHLIRTLRGQDADIYSAVNLVWHGLKPLPVGLEDLSKKQLELTDGVFFGPYEEGKPGVQPERIPPFSTTVNPGYDPSLPLYDPNALYLAMQAAMHPAGPQPCAWDHFETSPECPPAPEIIDPVRQVWFAGNRSGSVYDNLKSIGIPFAETGAAIPEFMIIDLSSLDTTERFPVIETANRTVSNGGTVLLTGLSPDTETAANRFLPQPMACIPDAASSLLPNPADERTACFSFEELYFAESYINRVIARYSLTGEIVENGTVLLSRNNTDWRRWLVGPEYSKTISIVRSELENRQNPVLVELPHQKGAYVVSTLEMEKIGDEHVALYRKLFSNLGVLLNEKEELSVPALDGAALVSALVLGRFGADALDAAIQTPFIDEASVRPKQDEVTGGLEWNLKTNNGDRFVFREMQQGGPEDVYTVYFSYWIYSPIDLGDLLGAGPDLPRVTKFCYVSDKGKVYLNGSELQPVRAAPVDYRIQMVFEQVPLKQGWNHFMIKVVSDSLRNADPGSLAVRLFSDNSAYDKQLKSAAERPER